MTWHWKPKYPCFTPHSVRALLASGTGGSRWQGFAFRVLVFPSPQLSIQLLYCQALELLVGSMVGFAALHVGERCELLVRAAIGCTASGQHGQGGGALVHGSFVQLGGVLDIVNCTSDSFGGGLYLSGDFSQLSGTASFQECDALGGTFCPSCFLH